MHDNESSEGGVDPSSDQHKFLIFFILIFFTLVNRQCFRPVPIMNAERVVNCPVFDSDRTFFVIWRVEKSI